MIVGLVHIFNIITPITVHINRILHACEWKTGLSNPMDSKGQELTRA